METERAVTFATIVAMLLTTAGARIGPDPAPQIDFATYRAALAELTRNGGTWRSSNAAYALADGGIDTFGMRHTLAPGGVSATGCLWGERAGVVVGVYWHFFQGWDPVGGRPLAYQSGTDGTVGIGHETLRTAERREMEQTFIGPDGFRRRIRHVSTGTGDTTRTASFDDAGDGWQPRRTYTWVRTEPGNAPC